MRPLSAAKPRDHHTVPATQLEILFQTQMPVGLADPGKSSACGWALPKSPQAMVESESLRSQENGFAFLPSQAQSSCIYTRATPLPFSLRTMRAVSLHHSNPSHYRAVSQLF